MIEIEPIRWRNGHLQLLDQRILPLHEEWIKVTNYQQAINAISNMVVRGAPAIGVTGAYAMVLASQNIPSDISIEEFLSEIRDIGQKIQVARPTAVNLAWAIGHCLDSIDHCSSVTEAKTLLMATAEAMQLQDVLANQLLGHHGSELIPNDAGILTHCNAGALATAGWGTALGVIRSAWDKGKQINVFCTETRPWLQGARLTAWELVRLGIPANLIVDSAAGSLMQQGKIQAVIVGADRIAANGDVANKIGTYSLAVLAKEHSIPFYVAAPVSTFDLLTGSGQDIQIEERGPDEVTHWAGKSIAPIGIHVINQAFDITPQHYVTAFMTEQGILRPPYIAKIRDLKSPEVLEIKS